MIIFIYGQDTFRSRQKLKEIIDHYREIHKSGLNLNYFDLKESNFEAFSDEIKTNSMFSEKKLFVLKNANANKDFKNSFLKNQKMFADLKDVILFYEEGDSDDKFSKVLKEMGKSQEYSLLGGEKLKNWIQKELKKYQAKISPEGLQELADSVGSDLWQMNNEIKKLASYKAGLLIGKEDVNILVKPKIESDIFKTIDALALKDKKRAFQLLKAHLEKGDSPLYLLSMINFQFRNLILVKSCQSRNQFPGNYIDLAKKLGIHPYVARKTTMQASRFSFEELKKIYKIIFQTDLSIKTGKLLPEAALELFVAAI